MKLLTFATADERRRPRLGALVGETVVDAGVLRSWAQGARQIPSQDLPASLDELIYAGPSSWSYLNALIDALGPEDPLHLKGAYRRPVGYTRGQVFLYPPLLRPGSLRDFYAFEAHVKAAFANRGKEIPAEWYHFPAFYFSNPNAIFGADETIPYPSYSQALDYELEVACVIGRSGMDIPPEKAEEHIFGYTIFNDWSARDVQQQEMRIGLGPAKGKDFASSLGPYVVTPDELADRAVGRPGVYRLEMKARINGQERSCGNWEQLHYSFGQMIARASAASPILPGDVIGSGTVGSGCLLELTEGKGPWLQVGDTVELDVERLGKLTNRIGPSLHPVPSP